LAHSIKTRGAQSLKKRVGWETKTIIFAPSNKNFMAKKNPLDQEVIVDVEQTIDKAEVFFQENKNYILGILGALVGIVAIWYAYNSLYMGPREAAAQVAMFPAEQHLANDSLNLALEGDGQNEGFLEIIDNYSGTKSANLAKYYAGVAYLNMGDYENAIKYLDQFKAKDQVLSIISKGAMGDAFLELGQAEEAIEFYEKAVKAGDNEALTPYYLKKAADTAMISGDFQKALKHLQRIKDDYNTSREAAEIEKHIAYVETKLAQA
jgi:tetratricopeptide (TPR) repeat protein